MEVGSLDDNPNAGCVPAVIPDSVPGAEQENQEEKPLRIMLLGKCGVGKSASGNTILGQHAFNSEMKLVRVTRYCEKATGIVNNVPIDGTTKVKNVPVAVIDTPGIFERDRTTDDIMQELLQCVKLQEEGPHAFVLVVPIERMTQEDQQTNSLIEAKFGPRVWNFTIVLFTHGDRLNETTINDVIADGDENLRNFIRKCGGGFHVFNNKDPQDHLQLTSFIAKIQTMVALNGGKHYDMSLYPKEERIIRERQVSILTERDAEIRQKERQLRQRFQGAELEVMKKKLWRKEEKEARLAAKEEEKMRNWSTWALVPVTGGMVICALLGLWFSALAFFLIFLWIYFKGFSSIARKIRWLTKKTA